MATFNKPSAVLGSSTRSERRYQTPFYCGFHATFQHSSGDGAGHGTVLSTAPRTLLLPSNVASVWGRGQTENIFPPCSKYSQRRPASCLCCPARLPISIDKWRPVIGPLIASQSVRARCDWSAYWPRYPANTGGCCGQLTVVRQLVCGAACPGQARQIIYNQQLKGRFHCNCCCCVRCYQSPVLAAWM